MVKPLVFNTPAPKPSTVPVSKPGGPKPLAFAPAPSLPLAAVEAPKVKPLAFAPAPPPKPVSSGPKMAFEQQLSPVAKAAVEELKASHAELYAKQGLHLERQINQLLPLDVTRVMSWAGKSLNAMTEVSTECAKLVREFYDTRGTDLIEETLKIITGKQSFFEKLANRSDDVSTVPKLHALKAQHSMLLPRVGDLIQQAEVVGQKLVNKMTSLRVICDVCGKLQDATLDDALHERQVLIAQSTTQAQLVIQQLQDVRRQLVDQMSRVEQLLVTTIPAYQNAKARR